MTENTNFHTPTAQAVRTEVDGQSTPLPKLYKAVSQLLSIRLFKCSHVKNVECILPSASRVQARYGLRK